MSHTTLAVTKHLSLFEDIVVIYQQVKMKREAHDLIFPRNKSFLKNNGLSILVPRPSL